MIEVIRRCVVEASVSGATGSGLVLCIAKPVAWYASEAHAEG